jgi:hypothetical protein
MVMSIFERKDTAERPGNRRALGLAVATALAFGGTMVLATAPAEAHYWHHHGGDVAAGVLGGLALGAVVGSALAAPPPPPVVYEEEPVYPVYAPRYVVHRYPACENFRRVDWRRHVWIDDFGRAHPCD